MPGAVNLAENPRTGSSWHYFARQTSNSIVNMYLSTHRLVTLSLYQRSMIINTKTHKGMRYRGKYLWTAQPCVRHQCHTPHS